MSPILDSGFLSTPPAETLSDVLFMSTPPAEAFSSGPDTGVPGEPPPVDPELPNEEPKHIKRYYIVCGRRVVE